MIVLGCMQMHGYTGAAVLHRPSPPVTVRDRLHPDSNRIPTGIRWVGVCAYVLTVRKLAPPPSSVLSVQPLLGGILDADLYNIPPVMRPLR